MIIHSYWHLPIRIPFLPRNICSFTTGLPENLAMVYPTSPYSCYARFAIGGERRQKIGKGLLWISRIDVETVAFDAQGRHVLL